MDQLPLLGSRVHERGFTSLPFAILRKGLIRKLSAVLHWYIDILSCYLERTHDITWTCCLLGGRSRHILPNHSWFDPGPDR